MIDIHSHILWQVDDGSQSFDMSCKMLRKAADSGTRVIFATPHVIENYGEDDWQDAKARAARLSRYCEEEKLGLKVILGAEVMMNWDLLPFLGRGGACCMGDTPYMLVELPMHEIPVYADAFWHELELKGIRPILAHPERYRRLDAKRELLLKWRGKGLLLQVNAGSVTGMWGDKAAGAARELILRGLCDFLGSDAHRDAGRDTDMSKAAAKIRSFAGDSALQRLAEENPSRLAAGKTVFAAQAKPLRPKGFFARLLGR